MPATNTQKNAATPRKTRRQGKSEGDVQGSNASSPVQRNDNHRDMHITSVTKGYKGSIPELGGALGFRTENVDVKVAFKILCKKLSTYIMKEFTQGRT